ncbi:MAG: hypothetical protein HFI22_07920 [Lachnospiraceae bacterium]|jgi:ABC-type sugar transport system ATPase subunit|nr:hypothetical protein [Lachnospiraceae bacterium]
MKKVILEGRGLSVKGEKNIVLRNGSFSIYEGELLAFCQTSQFEPFLPVILNTSQLEYEGELLFLKKPVNRKNPVSAMYISGPDMLIDSMSIADNLLAIRKHRGIPVFYHTGKAERNLRIILKELKLPFDLSLPISRLTASQKYMLLLLKALLLDVPIIVLDNISQQCSRDDYPWIKELVFRYRQRGRTFVLLANDCNFLLDQCERIYFCRGKQIVDLIFRDEYSSDIFQRILFGHPVQALAKRETRADYSAEVLEITLPRDWYAQEKLKIFRGEIFGILDLYGTLTPQIFRLFLEGFPYTLNGKICRNYYEAVRLGLAPVSLHLGNMVFESLSLSENLLLLKMKELSRGLVRNKRLEAYCLESCLPSLSAAYTQSEWDLEQLKLFVYRWLLIKPKVMVIDNPPFDMANEQRQELLELLEEVVASGCAVVLNSTARNECMNLCDRVLAIHGQEKSELWSCRER